MAEPLDVTARLAEGRPAVDTIGEYVSACRLLGYQNPDLTLHAAQVSDWYGSEDGMDLRALDDDRAALDAVAAATDSARQLQDQQLDVLAGAWHGRGGDASREFLLRHGASSDAAAEAVRTAVGALAALRDELWRAVDDKVAAAVAIDDRREAQRTEWLTASHTVTTGAGDRAAASELIDQQVKPFVDNDIRADWLTAMQKAMAAVSAAFDAAASAMAGAPETPFDVPGDLGPVSAPPPSPSSAPADVAGTTPAGWPAPVPSAPAAPMAPAPMAPAPMAAPAPSAPPALDPLAAGVPATAPAGMAPATATPAMPTMPSLGEMGGGVPGGAGGLAGLGSQLADAIGGLLDRPGDALPDRHELTDETVDVDEPEPEDKEPEPDDDDVEDPEDESDEETDELADTDEPLNEPVDACEEKESIDEAPSPVAVPTPPPAPVPPPPQPIVEPPPTAEPLGAKTPCEIAADELPQAGP
ncbi:hypothetical protein A5662_00135 [Mycobacteriaceae bacterium 1482268.1]|nr:hypothetical protein A5662_00135 [Mycobacteriaceae bacterium 1482268.1]